MKEEKTCELNVLKNKISRRKFLSLSMFSFLAGLLPVKAIASVTNLILPERVLNFYNPYNEEAIETVYWKDGSYVSEALDEINHVLRDIRTGVVAAIDVTLLDLLHAVNQKIGNTKPFQIISGYRTPASNALLRKKTKKVAQNSLHIYGKAADIRVPGFSLEEIKLAAMELQCGGVGYYPKSNYLHIDVGDVRHWTG